MLDRFFVLAVVFVGHTGDGANRNTLRKLDSVCTVCLTKVGTVASALKVIDTTLASENKESASTLVLLEPTVRNRVLHPGCSFQQGR